MPRPAPRMTPAIWAADPGNSSFLFDNNGNGNKFAPGAIKNGQLVTSLQGLGPRLKQNMDQ